MVVIQEPHTTSCWFCLKSQNDVATLVAGPGVCICDQCVDLCRQIISSPPPMPPGLNSWEEDLDLDGVLASLPRMAAAGAQVERNLSRFVKRARDLGATWAAIGTALGMTRQSAWERFSGEEYGGPGVRPSLDALCSPRQAPSARDLRPWRVPGTTIHSYSQPCPPCPQGRGDPIRVRRSDPYRGLTKRYGDVAALDHLDLDVARGEVVGYLGPNGAGKTTTIRLLLGLIQPTEGRAEIFGLDCQQRPVEVHRRLAFVAGEADLWPSLTGAETLALLGRVSGGSTRPTGTSW